MNRKLVIATAAIAVALGAVGIAGASNASPFTPLGAASVKAAVTPPFTAGVQPDGSQVQCFDVRTGSATLHAYFAPNGGVSACPTGYFQHVTPAPIAGPKGDTGATGAAGATGATGPAGPAGPAGTSAVASVTGTTNVTSWLESSGWASDDFTRSVAVTRQAAVDNSNCAGAKTCFFDTFTLTDNGTFTTVNGKNSPNGSSSDKVTGAFAGTMQGVATGSFYTDSALLTGTIPVSATGASKPASTTDWATLALPAGAHAYGTKLTGYSWDYNLTIAAGSGCTATSHQEWLDQINPGDDGQGASDGNVVGTTNC